jgi:hypothetical protein
MASVDFVLFDNGQAVATLTPEDKAGLDTTLPAGTSVPVWTSSNPAVVVSGSTDGLSAIVTPATPPVLATGVTVTATATLPDGTVITGVSDPIDVTGSAVAGFKISLK